MACIDGTTDSVASNEIPFAAVHQGFVPHDSGLNSLVVVAQLSGIAASTERLKHLAGQIGTIDALTIVRLAGQIALKARLITSQLARIPHMPLPAIVELKNGSFLTLLKSSSDAVLLHDPIQRQTFQMPLAEFGKIWSSRLILVTSRAVLAQGGSKFGVSWFIPSIVKYRKQFMEVLAGSFFIQLFGLVSPLFMQVVIDKV